MTFGTMEQKRKSKSRVSVRMSESKRHSVKSSVQTPAVTEDPVKTDGKEETENAQVEGEAGDQKQDEVDKPKQDGEGEPKEGEAVERPSVKLSAKMSTKKMKKLMEGKLKTDFDSCLTPEEKKAKKDAKKKKGKGKGKKSKSVSESADTG
ncbi:PREDICTED: uncharacterized protein LOC108564875 [Nicrophorus vespilloides]|uniref:Uncharacterized protein LOC108564875 n=1 Tax=Nicrophorus vespilloides TaxID=110193 RepID=A0ABM1MYA9_NICVS|nr:PREDICTED: uncharacterized protein LOC108564875 [Nicrophorus vespilloides]